MLVFLFLGDSWESGWSLQVGKLMALLKSKNWKALLGAEVLLPKGWSLVLIF